MNVELAGSKKHALASPSLIGREHIVATLKEWLDQRSRSESPARVALIAGEAGVGKTRLVTEVKRLASEDEYLIFQGNCFEQDRGLPYESLRDLVLNDILPSTSAYRKSDSIVHPSGSLSDLLGRRVTVENREGVRQQISDVLIQFLSEPTPLEPVLVVFEDLHWCDEATLDCLLHLVRHTRNLRISFVFTFRTDEPYSTLQHALAGLDRTRSSMEFKLLPLSPDQTKAMIQDIFDHAQPVQPDFAESIHTLTEGNPFFVEKVLKSLELAGALYLTSRGWSCRPISRLPIPRTLQDIVQQRMKGLSEPASNLLVRASVAGRRSHFALLENLTKMGEPELNVRIKELLDANLLVEESADQVTFRHELTRQAVYSLLLLRERRALHQVVGEVIEQMAGAPETRAGELAFHFDQAQQWSKAFEYSLLAGEEARMHYAPQGAIEHYSRALNAAQQLERAVPIGILRGRGNAYEMLGQFEAAHSDYEAVLAQSRQIHDPFSEWQAQIDLGFLWAGRDYTRAGEHLRGALELARDLDNATMLAQSLNRLGNWHMMVEQPLEARQCHSEALKLYHELKDQRGIAETLDLLGTSSISAGQVSDGAEYYLQAIPLFRELDDRQGLASTLTMLGFASRQYFSNIYFIIAPLRVSSSIESVEQALQLVREIHWRSGESLARTLLGMLHGTRGEYGHAFHEMQTGLAIATEIGHQQWLITSHLALGGLYQDLLDLSEAQAHFEAALKSAQAINSLYWRRTAAGMLAATFVGQGELVRAKAVLEDVSLPDLPTITMGERHVWAARAELALAENNPTEALGIIERLVARVPNSTSVGANSIVRLAVVRAGALQQLDRLEEAATVLDEALNSARNENVRSAEWRVHAARATLENRRRRHDDALRETASARHIIEALATTIPDARLAENLLRNANPLSPLAFVTGSTAKDPRELSPREHEVAKLVAEGKSNRIIAAQLVLSERTVEKHIENIMSKLGLTVRTQIAVWVVENGRKSASPADYVPPSR